MNNTSKRICQALSLRTPQKESLEILAKVADILALRNDEDIFEAFKKVHEVYPSVEDFERDFPSVCFALATGVGKTRLMGAFISYLYVEKRLRNFFILAPNLTIYRKLITDFTPNTAKYVFSGIPQFAQDPPCVITGDDYHYRGTFLDDYDKIRINIFNISKINSDTDARGIPRIRKMSEYLGESYFDYLAGLNDLVLLMDEAHRYRAKAGMKAINELRPVLGIELTATPQIEKNSKAKRFKNIIYNYPLSHAMRDGYVKHPAVVGRSDFNKNDFSDEQLERLKLRDGACVHEEVKTQLAVYAENNKARYVKPFMLVIAKDTVHAEKLKNFLESEDFRDGFYQKKIIVVHSAQKGEEKDETVEKLLSVEDTSEPTEIVIHVNMLKEGWDVNNLYTIVPLRRSDSRTLVEQSIGRGLRLPYGKHTNIDAIDRLNIVAHDKFNEIITEARSHNFSFQKIYIDEEVGEQAKKPKKIYPVFEARLGLGVNDKHVLSEQKGEYIFATPREEKISEITLQVMKEKACDLPNSNNFLKSEIRENVSEEVRKRFKSQTELSQIAFDDEVILNNTITKTISIVVNNMIDIPHITFELKRIADYSFDPFEIDFKSIGKPKPFDQEIIIKPLVKADKTNELKIEKTDEKKNEDLKEYILVPFGKKSCISYSKHAEILHNLSEQVIMYLRSYLPDDNAVLNVL